MFGCEFQPTSREEGREALHSPAGTVQTQNGEASGLAPEVLHAVASTSHPTVHSVVFLPLLPGGLLLLLLGALFVYTLMDLLMFALELRRSGLTTPT